jgi:hypothetical protein
MNRKHFTIGFILSAVFLISCSEFVDIGTPKTQIVRSKVFESDAGARAAVVGIFSQMMSGSSLAGGGLFSATVIGGLSSDEFINHSTSIDYVTLYNNSLTPLNSAVASNWNDLYLFIYEANSILEGCEASAGLSKGIRDQVIGEAKFIRAFSYFYLVNLFGDVPLILGTDYRVNSLASRTPITEVYKQIEADLLEAQKLLLPDFSASNNEKVEPNKWAATALLARVYLYQKHWAEAEVQSSAIIDSQVFSLVSNLNSVFLKNSSEAIWQMMPVLPGNNTNEAGQMIIISTPNRWSLTSSATDVFVPADKRGTSWIGTFTTGGRTYKYPFKYKIRLRDQPITEYYSVLRFAEQYLIRAEARAMQNNVASAVSDLNLLRSRAGVTVVDAAGLTQNDVIVAIERERRAELVGEWGHRWFDLKRWGTIDAVLAPIKADWQSKDALFPIPQPDIDANPNLVQNP